MHAGQAQKSEQTSDGVIAYPSGLFRRSILPDFLIIGAQKAGTTSLASYLAAHPCVVAPKWKEVHFFDLNYANGVDWYRSHFPIATARLLKSRFHGQPLRAGDATPYYLLHPQAPSRAADLIPTARIIILLRDPVDRAYSHYHHEVRLGKETLSFDKAIEAERSRIDGEHERLENEPSYQSVSYQHFTYLARGLYADQIARWLNYYCPAQFLVLSSEQFFESPARAYENVLKFLGLPSWQLPAYPAEHVGRYVPMSAATRGWLRQFYAPHNQILRRQLNSKWPGSGDAIVGRFST
jgi:hypothetical protein